METLGVAVAWVVAVVGIGMWALEETRIYVCGVCSGSLIGAGTVLAVFALLRHYGCVG